MENDNVVRLAAAGAIHKGPATRLSGRRLDGGWLVGERLDRMPGATGGLCSVGYRVSRDDGRTAFMKAHDYARAIQQGGSNFSTVLEDMLAAYNLEKQVNDQCADARMSRVVRSLGAGAILVEGSELPVNYIIFELADGDIRHQFDEHSDNLAWKLRTLHQVAVGLAQLHRKGIIHQDLKPSNVLAFDAGAGSKIGDLGSAWFQGQTAPLLDQAFAGDPDYAPPECLYGYEIADVRNRLLARDIYLLGSLIPFLFMGVDATSALLVNLPRAHHPRRSALSFEDSLPYLREAFDQVVDSLADVCGEGELRRLAELFEQLCDPDPRSRGDRRPVGKHSKRFALDRAISLLNRLASAAETRAPHL
jgi:serine/threonine protein kinase